MQQGRTAEAQELMEQLRDLMNNMKVTQGDGSGSGKGSPGQQAMKDLGQTLRDQQKLSDDSFRDLQDGGPDGESLADRQKRLKDYIDQLRRSGTLPGAGDPKGTEGRKALDDAGRAMEDAEKALRDGDLPQALDKQAQALDALRQGIRHLGDAMAQNGADPADPNAQQAGPEGQRDPLGRDGTTGTQMGPDHGLLQGQDVYRRAQELLDEIRKRAGEQGRPDQERSYLKRLLDLF
jgi:broad specificity phosphatase PhoE